MLKRFELSNSSLVASKSADSPILVFVNPDAAERQMLLSRFSLDEHTLLSALDPDEVSRIEIEGDALLLIWKRPLDYSGQDNFCFNVASVGVFLFKDRLAVVLTEDVSIAPTGTRKVQRLDSLLNVVRRRTRHAQAKGKYTSRCAAQLNRPRSLCKGPYATSRISACGIGDGRLQEIAGPSH
jgi:magnesium transporter